jgi:hypothetical protein
VFEEKKMIEISPGSSDKVKEDVKFEEWNWEWN